MTFTAAMSTDTFRDTCSMSFTVSGASTVAAADAKSLRLNDDANTTHQASGSYLVTGLTAGSNTFTAVYKANNDQGGGNNTCTFSNRNIVVVPWPN